MKLIFEIGKTTRLREKGIDEMVFEWKLLKRTVRCFEDKTKSFLYQFARAKNGGKKAREKQHQVK